MTEMQSAAPERLFFAVASAVFAALLYNVAGKYAAVQGCMRYVPPESIAYIVTSPLGALWTGSTPHLQGYFEGGQAPGDGLIRRGALLLKKELEEIGIKPRSAADLTVLGIATDSNAALALVTSNGGPQLVLALPVIDREKFIDTFEKLFGDGDETPHETRLANLRAPIEYTAGSWTLSFGDDGTALIATDVALLRRVLASQQRNIEYYRNSDRHSSGFLKLLTGKQTSSQAWVRGAVRAMDAAELVGTPTFLLALISDVQFAFGFSADAQLELRGNLPNVRSELIARLLAPLTAGQDHGAELLERSEAAVVVADEALAIFAHVLTSGAGEESVARFDALFPGVLQELRELTTLTHAGVTMSEISERVPGVIAGLAMSQNEADELVFRLQSALRVKRDTEILQAAIEQYLNAPGSAEVDRSVTVDALLAACLLRPERNSLWSRYALTEGSTSVLVPKFSPSDFLNDSYINRQSDGTILRYVMPPVTDDDFDYRLSELKEEIEIDELKRDRYRLSSVYVGNTLWLGNDADVLGRWLDRLRSQHISTEYRELLAIDPSAAAAKVSLLALPRQLLESGELYPDSQVNETTRQMLSDLRQYRAVLLALTTRPGEREIDVRITLRR
jgi:hypothetical protein